MRAFIAEDGAVDSLLSAVVNEFAPYERCRRFFVSEDDLLAWACKYGSFPAVFVLVGAVMSFIKREDGAISILGKPPKRPV